MALLNCIPEETPGKKELQEYADKADSWIFGIDWANVPLDDAERILEGRPDILALYQAVPESVWKGEYQQVFFRYGVGVVIQDIFKPLFWDVIRPLPRYLPTRIYKTYTEEIRVSLMQDLETCKGLGKSAALVLDNKVGDARLAEQMIEDLKARDKHVCCPIYATIFSTATKDFMGESCETPELYIGYASKSEKLDGVHRNIVKAAINALIQQYKIKYKAVVNKNCDILAQIPIWLSIFMAWREQKASLVMNCYSNGFLLWQVMTWSKVTRCSNWCDFPEASMLMKQKSIGI